MMVLLVLKGCELKRILFNTKCPTQQYHLYGIFWTIDNNFFESPNYFGYPKSDYNTVIEMLPSRQVIN